MNGFRSTIDVYLGGPITYVDEGWRTEIAENLEKIGATSLVEVRVYIPQESPEMADGEIIDRDLKAISKSDIVVAYFFSETYGTSMECFYAFYMLKKPVFIICPLKKISPWLTGNSTKLYKSLKGFYAFFERYLQDSYQGG